MILNARHVEVQILGDKHGDIYHLWERDCSVQRRNQKVVERAPAPYLTQEQRDDVCELGLKIARAANYECAGTVEFLMDSDTGNFFFIEVNPRVQVEHTVTEEVTGIDIVPRPDPDRGGRDHRRGDRRPSQADVALNGNAIQCRITTEDPQNNFIPDYGRITAYRGATGTASASTAARPIPARSSPATTTRCWRRSPPGRRRPRWRSPASTARCASSASAASRPTSPSSRTC